MRNGMTRKQIELLAALVHEPDVQAATASAGVSRTTAYRWLKDPAFTVELANQRDAVLAAALERVKTSTSRAVAELTGLLGVKDERLRRLVCNDLLTHAMKVRELEDFEKRLTALERTMVRKEKGGEA